MHKTAYQNLDALKDAPPQERPTIVGETESKATRRIKDAPVVAIYSPKGGVGASTISANLSMVWQKILGNVILMDADLQFGDIMVHLNVKSQHTMATLVDTDEIDTEILHQVMVQHSSGLKLMLAPPKPELADLITQDMLKQIIKLMKKEFKLIVVDTSTMLTDQMLTILDNADYLVVVTNPKLPAIKSTKLFLEFLQKLKFSFDRVCVVVNQANIPNGIAPEQIKKVLKLQDLQYLPDDPQLYHATNQGKTVFELSTEAPSARMFAALAQHIWQDITRLIKAP